MTFALPNAKLWGYIIGNQTKPPDLIKKKDDNKSRLEKINLQKLNSLKFDKKQ